VAGARRAAQLSTTARRAAIEATFAMTKPCRRACQILCRIKAAKESKPHAASSMRPDRSYPIDLIDFSSASTLAQQQRRRRTAESVIVQDTAEAPCRACARKRSALQS